jgi:glycosyltransferase involved in cell wall biosynthesis
VSAQKDPALFNTIALYFQPVLSGGAGTKDGTLFYWIGEGPEGAKLDRNRIHLTGWKEPEAVRALLEKTAVYLSCSAWEGLPYGVLEAMNASCALLLRDVPGNRDLVVPGENGRLFTGPEEACRLLQDMLAEPEKTADMGKRSRAILEERFSQKAMGAGYRRVYAKTLGTPNSFAEDREAHSRGEALP